LWKGKKKNAFKMLMQSARTNTENEFLIVIANPANKKDAL